MAIKQEEIKNADKPVVKKTTATTATAKKPVAKKATTVKTATTATAKKPVVKKAASVKTVSKEVVSKVAPKAVEIKKETVKAAPKKAEYNGPMVKITLIKSTIGRLIKQKKTIEALGLRKIRSQVIKRDDACTRGMIYVVKHLVSVEEVK